MLDAITTMRPRRNANTSSGPAWFGERFRVVGEIGEGGMGTVYEVIDRDRGVPVALKTLRKRDAKSIVRFKNEFRSLADVLHPNLVRLHELFHQDGQWFFTMDLVRGRRLDRWLEVRPDTLVDVYRQLVAGIAGLHGAGLLHRDLKPSNVLVEDDGHVVVVDFGLVVEHGARPVGDTYTPNVAGTPRYMSPEQRHQLPVGPPADWYALGVMLNDSLRADAHHPELDDLGERLIEFDFEDRPSTVQILEAFGQPSAVATARTPDRQTFVGRAAQLDALRRDHLAVQARQTHSTFVHGVSGIGKSALVHRFLGEVRGEAVVLEGRCLEHERVPFNAFDIVVDALVRTLRGLDPREAACLLPRGIHSAARIFPGIRRLEVLECAPHGAPVLGASELHRQGLEALMALIANLADRRPVVIFVDDLQWADQGSVGLWQDLQRLQHARIHLIGTCRTGECEGSFSSLANSTHIELGPLSPEEVLALAYTQLPPDVDVEPAVAAADGHPGFLFQLLDALQDPTLGDAAGLTWVDVVHDQVDGLRPDARILLEAVAVSGCATREWVIEEVSGLDDFAGALRLLIIHRLVRTRKGLVECYHEPIREAVVARMDSPSLQAVHRKLATVLGAHPLPDPERICQHWHGAGDRVRGALWAEFAAQAALHDSAFESAARWYGLALQNPGLTRVHRRTLLIGQAEALGGAGAGWKAARCLLDAAALADGSKWALWRGAALHLLLGSLRLSGS